MDRELLLEIGVEELPAAWLPGLTTQLGARLQARLSEQGLGPKLAVETHSTLRRLTACVGELIDRQEDRDEKIMGPPVSAAFDAEGHPTNAGLGFARKNNADFDALLRIDTPKGKYLAYEKHTRGRATVDVLPEILSQVLRDLAFPKHMHWDAMLDDGKGELVFGRPIRWLLFLYGGRVVPFTIARQPGASSPRVQDVSSGAVTYGHRFLATSGRAGRAIKVRTFDEYRKKLTENFVLLSRIERRDRIMRDLDAQARKIGGRAMVHQHLQTEALLAEVPDLVEFPAVVAGAFKPEFLSLPEEVLTTTLIHHQHYFPVLGSTGALMPAFLAVTNTQASNDRGIATNAERVVAARLRDARFFWEADKKVGLEARVARLETLLFHKQLGSYRQKAERIEKLAGWLARDVFQRPDAADAAARAARFAKADLTTDMVREFTELQGVMGGIYAREAGEPEPVWKAIYHHYQPIAVEADGPPKVDQLGQGRVTWACVSLADKLDTLVGLFLAGERPTGSRDPFGLRRQAHGLLRILLDVEALSGVKARPSLRQLVDAAVEAYGKQPQAEDADSLNTFLRERLEFVLEARKFDRRNVRALSRGLADITAIRPSDVMESLKELTAFGVTPDFIGLATAFKRVRNIAKEMPIEEYAALKQQGFQAGAAEDAEKQLVDEIAAREGAIRRASETGVGWHEAYKTASGFAPSVAKYFDDVMVMDPNPGLRKQRLFTMRRLEEIILCLGDISEIVATET
jgi:glycyl-tRNA synthetase beta chain